MNSTTHSLSEPLARQVDAVINHMPEQATVDAAQKRLETSLARFRPRLRMRRKLTWLGAACTAVIVLALALGPVFIGNDGAAFAAVQQRLRDFHTLSMTMTQRSHGMDLPTIHTWMDRSGNVRTDIGHSTSVIINTDDQTMLILLHASHRAMRMPIAANKDDIARKSLSWLDEVRKFQGQARQLPGSRIIDGHTTHGWVLDTAGMHIEIWADADGVPRTIDIGGHADLHQQVQLNVDQPIDPARFSTRLPDKYTLMQPD